MERSKIGPSWRVSGCHLQQRWGSRCRHCGPQHKQASQRKVSGRSLHSPPRDLPPPPGYTLRPTEQTTPSVIAFNDTHGAAPCDLHRGRQKNRRAHDFMHHVTVKVLHTQLLQKASSFRRIQSKFQSPRFWIWWDLLFWANTNKMNKKSKTFLSLDIFSRICRQGDDSFTWIFSCKEKEWQLLTPDRQADRLAYLGHGSGLHSEADLYPPPAEFDTPLSCENKSRSMNSCCCWPLTLL